MTAEAPSTTAAAPPGDAAPADAPKAKASYRVRHGALRTWRAARVTSARLWAAGVVATRWVGSKLGPVVAVVSPAGWMIALLGVVLAVAGVVLGWAEFTTAAAAIGVAFVLAAAFLVGRSTYAVTIELSPKRVVVGGKARGRIVVANSGGRSLLPSRLELPVGAGLAEFGIPALKPAAEHDEFFAVPTNRRAVIVAGPAVSVRGDQLGLFRRTVRWTDPVDLFVHPLTVPLSPSAAGLVRDLEGQVTKKITNNDISFHALRDYVPGDDRRYIHWRSSARTGQLMVRQFEETRRSQVTMLVSENVADYASENEFELAVSIAASIAKQVIRDGTQINVIGDSRHLRTHSPNSMLDDSCRLDLRVRKHADARAWARVTTARLPAPSVLMIIGGSQMPIDAYRAIESLFPVDTTILGFRAAEGAVPALRKVSRMQVMTVGELKELAPVLRRAAG